MIDKRLIAKHLTIATVVLYTAATASSQTLKTEIEVDRTIVPQQRDAQRPTDATPELLDAPHQNASLLPADYLGPGIATTTMSTLQAPAWMSTIAHTPYRGYASLGYFPLYNLDASAGYRLVDTQKTQIGAWMQYNGLKYKGKEIVFEDDQSKHQYKQHFITAGVNAVYAPDAVSAFVADAAYSHASVYMPLWSSDFVGGFDNTANDFRLKLLWQSEVGQLGYHMGADLGYFGYGDNDYCRVVQRQAAYGVNAGAYYKINDDNGLRAGVDLSIDGLRTRKNSLVYDGEGKPLLAAVTPYLSLGKGALDVRIGAKLGFGKGVDVASKFSVAPDLRLAYSLPKVGLYLDVTGGQKLNPLSEMFWRNPYSWPAMWYYCSNMAVNAQAGIDAVLAPGLKVGVHGGVAIAKQWYLPALLSQGWRQYDKIKSGLLGVKASYQGEKFGVKADAELGFSNAEGINAWLMWDDLSECRLSLSANVKPISKLTIEAGFEYHGNCALPRYDGFDVDLGYDAEVDYFPPLHELQESTVTTRDVPSGTLASRKQNICNLWLRADYAINDAVNVFAVGQNLTNCQYYHVSGYQAQGVHGLVGIAVKF